MRFGDFVWPHNPKIYEIEYNRRIVCHKVPFGLYVLSDMYEMHLYSLYQQILFVLDQPYIKKISLNIY